jgi:hypothetical protein
MVQQPKQTEHFIMRFTTLAAAALAVMTAAAAQAATVPFLVDNPTTARTAPSIAGTVNGVGFTMTGFTTTDALTPRTAANVGYGDAGAGFGFGVAGVTGSIPAGQSKGTPTTAGPYTIDGIGVNKNEGLRISFAQTVLVTSFLFALVDRFDDVYVVVDGQAGQRYGLVNGVPNDPSTVILNNPLVVALTGRVFDIVGGFPNPECATTSSNPCGGANDLFQLQGADVTPVPLPAALPLLAAAFGGLALFRRRAAAA